MLDSIENPSFSRRGALLLAASAGLAGWSRIYAASADFWNKKDPSDWSRDEIEQLTSKSPWAKEISVEIPAPRGNYDGQNGQGGQNGGQGGTMGSPGGYPGGPWGGGPRIGGMGGGMGIPGMGGPMGGGGGMGRRGGGQPMQNYRGTIRWESAKPVLEALKTGIPDSFSGRYVISVSGIPLQPNSRRGYQDDDDSDSSSRSQSTRDMLDRLKSLTSLEPKGRPDAQPGVVEQQTTAGLGSILFGFSKDTLSLKPEDKEVTFSTQFGRTVVRTKFNLKDMLYRGEIAL